MGVTGLILTKLDGSARGGCVVFLFILYLNRYNNFGLNKFSLWVLSSVTTK